MANKTSKQTNKQQNKPFFSTFVFSLNSAFTSPEISSSSTSLQTKVKTVKRVTLWQAICQCTGVHILLMLWCTDKKKKKIHKALMGKVGQRKASSDRTHQFRDNPPDEGPQHIVSCRRGALCRVLHGEHGSNTHVAGVISLAKLSKSSRIPMLFPDRASAQG